MILVRAVMLSSEGQRQAESLIAATSARPWMTETVGEVAGKKATRCSLGHHNITILARS